MVAIEAGNPYGLSEGDYVLLREGGNETPTTVNIERVEVNDIQSVSGQAKLTFYKAFAPADVVEAPIEPESEPEISMSQNDVIKDVRDISTAWIDAKLKLVMKFNNENNVNKFTLKKGFEITLPDFISLQEEAVSGSVYEIIDGHILRFTEDWILNKQNTEQAIYVDIEKVDFTQPGASFIAKTDMNGNPIPGELNLNGKIEIQGKATLHKTDMPEDIVVFSLQTRAEIVENVYSDRNSLKITEVTGKVDPDINIEVDPVDITDLPEFLQDEDVEIDMSNPRIFLTIENGAPVGVNLNATLKAFKKGNETGTVSIGQGATAPIVIEKNAVTRICLCRTTPAVLPAETKVILVDNINDLIRKIPERIEIENIQAKAIQEEITIKLGSEYKVNTDYEVIAPLSFGPNLNIVYKDTMDGWNTDIEDFDIKTAIVEMTAENGIPLHLSLSAQAVDLNGNLLPDVKATVTGEIAPGKPGTKTVSPVKVRLESLRPNALKSLDGLMVQFNATSGNADFQHINLNENQTMRFTQIRIRIEDGVKIDLN